MRMTGLASGLDVDSMVKELMKARRTTYDNMIKKRTQLEWQQEDYRTMSSKIVDFRNNKLSSFNMSNAISAKKTELSGDTNAIAINATGSTATGSMNVKVTEVATTANKVYSFNSPTSTTTLEDIGGFTPNADPNFYDIGINGKTLTIAKTATLQDVSNAINNSSSTFKATALYDQASGKFSISATVTGSGDPGFAGGVNVTGFAGTLDSSTAGKDAQISVNGISYKQSSNRFDLNGYDFTVKAQSQSGSTTTLTATQDTSKLLKRLSHLLRSITA